MLDKIEVKTALEWEYLDGGPPSPSLHLWLIKIQRIDLENRNQKHNEVFWGLASI